MRCSHIADSSSNLCDPAQLKGCCCNFPRHRWVTQAAACSVQCRLKHLVLQACSSVFRPKDSVLQLRCGCSINGVNTKVSRAGAPDGGVLLLHQGAELLIQVARLLGQLRVAQAHSAARLIDQVDRLVRQEAAAQGRAMSCSAQYNICQMSDSVSQGWCLKACPSRNFILVQQCQQNAARPHIREQTGM